MEHTLRLIAVKPLPNCQPKLLKVLKEKEIYLLSKGYSIIPTASGEDHIIAPEHDIPEIFNVGHIEVSLSAIAGKNGSGKSSITELIYAILYNIAHRLKLVDLLDEDDVAFEYEANVNADLYYLMRGKYFRLRSHGNELTLSEFKDTLLGFEKESPISEIDDLDQLFYSVVINYSLYGLNTLEIGHWIKALFHKNDAYQTPVVLNPFRRRGNIDINTENYLVRSRLLANLIAQSDFSLWFNNEGKLPRRVTFALNEKKLTFKSYERERIEVVERYNDHWGPIDLFIRASFFDGKQFDLGSGKSEELAKKYILAKLVSMCRRYKLYHQYRGFLTDNVKMPNLIAAIKKDPSHVAYKIKQAIYFLYLHTLPHGRTKFARTVSGLRSRIADILNTYPDIPLIALAAPSFYDIDIEFKDMNDRFSYLSSGEKQKLYALSSLIYHLRNLNSVESQENKLLPPSMKLVKYKYVNIIFDEVELYYHPEFQRSFINDLFDNIKAANLDEIKGINFIFITHSPFILSDIPNNNILYLKSMNGKAEQWPQANETFGANIHDLLANSFFLEEYGYMGEHARQVITSAFYYLTPENKRKDKNRPKLNFQWDRTLVRAVIDMVGEPLIKRSLNELFADKFLLDDDEIEREINRLRSLQKKERKENEE